MIFSALKKILICICLIIIGGCEFGQKIKNESPTKPPNLFEILSPQSTGLDFVNQIIESPKLNGIVYEYLYNGGGVAAGDFNGDGLVDLYFTSNLNSNELYLNKGLLRFQRVTAQAHIKGKDGFSTGVTTVDINNDGLLDIYISKSGNYKDPKLLKNELYINTGNNSENVPVFEENSAAYGLDIADHSTQATFFDYDKDGDLDMFLLNHGINPGQTETNIDKFIKTKSQNSNNKLYRNDNNYFTDVSKISGIINNSIGYGLGVAIGDLNNDHWPDIVVGMDYSEKDHLYINQKNGAFKEVIRTATNHISNFSMGNDIGDINNDGHFDYISVDMVSNNNYDLKTNMSGMNPKRFHNLVGKGLHYQYMFNTLQLNNGNMLANGTIPAFSDVAQITGLAKTNWSWAPLFFDMDNDGKQDLFVSNGVLRSFRNNDFNNYKSQRVKELYADFNKFSNRDSLIQKYYEDLLAIMPEKKEFNLFYHNNGNYNFSEVINSSFMPTASNGAVYADLDNDGDLDLVANNINDPAFIYKNNSNEYTNSKHYIKLRFKGSGKNTSGIGARIIIETNGQQQTKELYPSRGFQSAMTHELHFGLGDNKNIEKLTVIWPNNTSENLLNVHADQLITLYQKNATENPPLINTPPQPLFTTVNLSGVDFIHSENIYDDFEKEILLPHKYSQNGPALSVGDVNGDGLDDFYVGGAKNQSAALFLQNLDCSFSKISSGPWLADLSQEDIASQFFDADQDGDLDLYVVSGGNEAPENDDYYQHRLYENLGEGRFKKNISAIPNIKISGATVIAGDYDKDGNLDLFIGGKIVPGKYPYSTKSYLLQNKSSKNQIKFVDVTTEKAPLLHELGLVSDAKWVDIDQDQDLDLLIVGEWMPLTILENNNGIFTNSTTKAALDQYTGWWYSIAVQDFDGDGDIDFIAGNLGKNYKYKATKEEPFEVYANDFDDNGSLDIVLSYHENGKLYPLRGRQCSSDQMPFIKKKFPSYNEFGTADISKVYGEKALQSSLHLLSNSFASVYVENLGDFKFKVHELDALSQFSSVNSILICDFNEDGNSDALLTGNLYQAEVETTRNDSSYGLVLLGIGNGDFRTLLPVESGLFVKGDVKQARLFTTAKGEKQMLFAKNNSKLQAVRLN